MKKRLRFCWKESTHDGWFTEDKLIHAVCHILSTLLFVVVLYRYFSLTLTGIIVWAAILDNLLGLAWEAFETTAIWEKVAGWWGLGSGQRARCMSVKDLIANNVGMILALIVIG